MPTQPSIPAARRRGETGSTIVLVLILIGVLTLLGMTLIFTTEVELGSSVAYRDRAAALSNTDSAIHELLYRFNLTQGAAPPPTGSTFDVNATKDLDAFLNYDPDNLLDNGVDDDGDGSVDEPDELNLARDWAVRIVLKSDATIPGGLPADVYVVDGDVANGPPWGNRTIVQTIQLDSSWQLYSSDDPESPDALIVRFKLDTDTALGDSEGDGPEVVFYDPSLAANSVEDPNTLTSLGGDADPANDSPFNITWSNGAKTYPATGQPVLLVTATGRAGNTGQAARRIVEAELVRTVRPVFPKAICGCIDVSVSGVVDSYKSSEGVYGSGPIYDNGDVGSNGDLTLTGGGLVTGTGESSNQTKLSGMIMKDAWAGDAIVTTAEVAGTAHEFYTPRPAPCPCDLYDLPTVMAEKKAANDNAAILPDGIHPYEQGTCDVDKKSMWKKAFQLDVGAKQTVILTGGEYYVEQLKVTELVQVGVDTDGDCMVDDPPTEPVIIYVNGDVDLSGQGIVNASNRPEDLQIIMLSASNSLDISGGFTYRGTIYFPGENCNISGGAVIEGALVCGSFKGGGDGIHYDEDLSQRLYVDDGVQLINWRELG